ncbi:type I 3-dehydroquinate dehydratase [Propionibacterium australiense]|uniref:Type I 3-dehydroquinate dehydratase n=1 Tax=Propionibacterium australiense TaxID=119981 RepID=A0A8B3GG69_9ACTN|nr:type I 3-dehydroquinate dehydratase [Propionibacterium australiense]
MELATVELGGTRPAIIVPLTAPGEAQLLAQADRAAASPADIVEWRVDLLDDPTPARAGLLASRLAARAARPLLTTVRTAAEGGRFDRGTDGYAELVAALAVSGASIWWTSSARAPARRGSSPRCTTPAGASSAPTMTSPRHPGSTRCSTGCAPRPPPGRTCARSPSCPGSRPTWRACSRPVPWPVPSWRSRSSRWPWARWGSPAASWAGTSVRRPVSPRSARTSPRRASFRWMTWCRSWPPSTGCAAADRGAPAQRQLSRTSASRAGRLARQWARSCAAHSSQCVANSSPSRPSARALRSSWFIASHRRVVASGAESRVRAPQPSTSRAAAGSRSTLVVRCCPDQSQRQ